ncbi:Phosphotransferase system, EIIC component, type 2 [Acididesulfobacillus acetoxydans]|uniref:Galactitol permease IIC component n=1 Tax=Acididesulfobacillus acetoxydans TaxID=1561005 RepID=A0A8S0VWI0_9FIRM|nr:PTS transporter subunit IIC [Acididesulfobacillus acetoxydans]CAA7600893.1 Phosphotransferase system, EIIC component, type 2 [Acididesulfobacillus acetoxydans]CEJ08299.1 Galactitol permease IIC component [Acididesulfobacillus acetoxydans]
MQAIGLMEVGRYIQVFLGFGSAVILPIIIFIFGLIIGQPAGRAFRSALTIGIGLTGVTLVVNLLTGQLGPAAEQMIKVTGIQLSVIDVGWPTMAAMTWAWIGAALVFPLGIALNAIMLWRGWTKTMNIDLWNYWQFAFIGAAVYFLTNNLLWGWLAATIASGVALVFADMTQRWVERYFNLPGISFPHLTAVGWLPLFLPIIGLLNSFKWWRNMPRITPESVQKRFGIFGQPMVWGLILGILIGILARENLSGILTLGVSMAAVMLLLPRMVSVLMEGLIPISETARGFLQKRFPNRKDLFIGMDAALAIGHPSVIATGLILVPITLVLAFILPGNHILPFVDLAVWPFLICLVVAMNGGDVLRSVILGTIMSVGVLYSADIMWPLQTALAHASHVAIPSLASGHMGISNLDRQQFITFALVEVFSFFNSGISLVKDIIYGVIFLFLILSFWISPRLLAKMAAQEDREAALAEPKSTMPGSDKAM